MATHTQEQKLLSSEPEKLGTLGLVLIGTLGKV